MSAPAAALKRLWMRWSLAHLLPPIVATAAPHILAQASWKREVIGAVVFVVVGLTLAAAQALALRRAIPGAWRWALATIGGVALAFVATLPTLAVLDTGVDRKSVV